MYPNLYAELARKGMTKVALAKEIGMPFSTLADKLAGRTQFNLNELVAIRSKINPEVSLDYLFYTKNCR